ncbi:MAG TPA: condensation domain-containing protein, partial [Blastocatellia bacterium]|nr:condensation domain-containing protein [Blastocatellia bacterium]
MSTSNRAAGYPILNLDQVETGLFPLSASQQGVWFDQIYYRDLPMYNMGGKLLIEGPVDASLLKESINIVVGQNEALRLVLREVNGRPLQQVSPVAEVPLPVVDLSAEPDPEAAARDYLKREFQRPFQLEDGLLFSFQLVRVSPGRSYWLQRYHHLIADGFSVQLICQAVAAVYNRLLAGEPAIDSPVPSYRQYIDEEAEYQASERFQRDRTFWQERFSAPPAPLFPPSANSGSAPGPSGEVVWRIERRRFNEAAEYARAVGCTMPHFMLALVGGYFARISGEPELVIGVPIHNRHSPSQKRTVGMFASVLPLRIAVDPEGRFGDLMKTISAELRRCYKHQRLPITEINRFANLPAGGRKSLYDVSVAFDRFTFDYPLGGHRTEPQRMCSGFGQTPLAISVTEYDQQDEVLVVFEFNSNCLALDEAQRIQARMNLLLDSILAEPDLPLKRLPLLSPLEYHQIFVEWNTVEAAPARELCVHELFEARAEKDPGAVAVVDGEERLTYGQLNARANQLAHHLRELGVGSDVRVALCFERGLEMIVAL